MTHQKTILKTLEGIKVISFDVFDTLLVRPFLKPGDLFAFIAPEVERIIRRPIDFRKERMAAEYETRIALSQYQDITIHEIYDHFSTIPFHHREAVKQLELEQERQFIYAKKSGQELYAAAKASGHRVVAISDMYLEEDFIRDILFNLGYEFEVVYVSSRRREVKYNGSMFRAVLNDLKLQPWELLHIGDSEEYDIAPAKACGIGTFKVEKNSETFFRNRTNRFLWREDEVAEPGLSAVLGVTANTFFDRNASDFSYDEQSLFRGDPYTLGYSWFGPLLTAFTVQLLENTTDKKVLYFLSRDGWIMRQIYEIIAPYFENPPQTRYLYVSRKATALAPIRSFDDMRYKFGVVWFETTIEEWICDRIGIALEAGDDALARQYGFNEGLESKINFKNCHQFQRVLHVLSPRILAKAREERTLLIDYLKQEGVIIPSAGEKTQRIGFVDIGYHGQTPRNILLLSENYTIDLYFLIAGKEIFGLADEFGITIRGFYGERYRGTRVLDRDWKRFFRHHKLFETFFITDQGSVKGYECNAAGEVRPTFYPLKGGKEGVVAEAVHAGAIAFAKDFSRLFQNQLSNIHPDPNALMKSIFLFANYTDPQDARILEGALFEDYFSALPLQKVEWFAGRLAIRYPRLARARNATYRMINGLYRVPSIGRIYDRGYVIALRIYRRIRSLWRSFFIFKKFSSRT
ncbi:MAG: HAD-IA family hydrolase [Patescibacteria group bacterium]